MQGYIRENFVNEGMCADFAIHAGTHEHEGKPNNPHAHIMLTVRPINPDGTWGAKSKKEYILDKNGNRTKTKSGDWRSRKADAVDWDKTETLLKWRESWAAAVNHALERGGAGERVDHRTLAAQGVNRLPTVHLGHEAHRLEKSGIKTRRGNINREVELVNAEIRWIDTAIRALENQRIQIENREQPKPHESRAIEPPPHNLRVQARPDRGRPDRGRPAHDRRHGGFGHSRGR